jgi:hypothetical protein
LEQDRVADNLTSVAGQICPQFEHRRRFQNNDVCPDQRKNRVKRPQPGQPAKKPQFSVVIKHVDHDINQVLASLELQIQRLWRIKSRQSNKFTTLVRVITKDTATVDFLLNNGLTLFGKHHQCQPSKPPERIPLQCTKCYQLGHHATACTNKPACPKCPETHAPNNCEAETPKCLHCGGAQVVGGVHSPPEITPRQEVCRDRECTPRPDLPVVPSPS